MKRMATSPRSNRADTSCRGCSVHRPFRPKSPNHRIAEKDIDDLIENIEDNFQEAIRSLSSTIDTIREVNDVTASTSMVYEDIDNENILEDIMMSHDTEEDIEIEHYNSVTCNLSDCCDKSDFKIV